MRSDKRKRLIKKTQPSPHISLATGHVSHKGKPPVNATTDQCANQDGRKDEEEVTNTRYGQVLRLVGCA